MPEFFESINSMSEEDKMKMDKKLEAMNRSVHHCTLTNSELIAKAECWIDDLIKSGGKAFTMQVPARPNADTDLILSETVERFKAVLKYYDDLRAKCEKMEQALKAIADSDYPMTQKELDDWLLFAKRTARKAIPWHKKEGVIYIDETGEALELSGEKEPTIPQQGGMPVIGEPLISEDEVKAFEKLQQEEKVHQQGAVTEDELIGFAEWAAELAFFDDTYRLWEFYEEGKRVSGQFRFTTKEFFVLYKKAEGGEKEAVDGK